MIREILKILKRLTPQEAFSGVTARLPRRRCPGGVTVVFAINTVRDYDAGACHANPPHPPFFQMLS